MDNLFKATDRFARTINPDRMVEVSDKNPDSTLLLVSLDLIQRAPGALEAFVDWHPDPNERAGMGKHRLELDTSDRRATAALLHYVVHCTLPADYHQPEKDSRLQFTLARAWNLGATAEMSGFQDMVMRALLEHYDPEARWIDEQDNARYLGDEFWKMETQLYHLALETLAYGINEGSIELSELTKWQGSTKFWDDLGDCAEEV